MIQLAKKNFNLKRKNHGGDTQTLEEISEESCE